MKMCQTTLLLIASFAALSALAQAQAFTGPGDSSSADETIAPARIEQIDSSYVRPSQATKLRNYAFDAFGPYPIFGAAVVAGIGQADNTVPEWKQGAAGFGRRFGSDFGIAAASTTTRYAMGQVLREDTLYYRCECRGLFPRLSHAVVSTLTARHGQDGHRAFSVSAVVAPYAGTMTAVYGWYPDNYGARYALRLGNYNLLISAGQNILLEFFYSGPHSLLSRMHLNNSHGAPDSGSR
jgi:nitrate reductase NapE component